MVFMLNSGVLICGEYYLTFPNTNLQKDTQMKSSSSLFKEFENVNDICKGIKPTICWSLQVKQ